MLWSPASALRLLPSIALSSEQVQQQYQKIATTQELFFLSKNLTYYFYNIKSFIEVTNGSILVA